MISNVIGLVVDICIEHFEGLFAAMEPLCLANCEEKNE
jgi:hypothetical protein